MTRWVLAVGMLVAGIAWSSCGGNSCGPGTQQVQLKDGTTACELADVPSQFTPCDIDAGATIVGGLCVAAVSCGPNTTLQNGQCVGTGTGSMVPDCTNPMPGNMCINGTLLNFVDNAPSMSMVHVAVYDPIALLGGGAPLDQGNFTAGYRFSNIPAPPLGLVAIVVGDADGKNTTFANCATGDQGVLNGNKYRVDAYVLPRSVADGWKPQIDFNAGGAYVAKFFKDAKPLPTNEVATEMQPVAGVALTLNGGPATGAKYFGASLTTIDGALTTTSAIGAAIVNAPVTNGSFPSFSGMGAGITWESQPGGSANGLVFVTRFHPN